MIVVDNDVISYFWLDAARSSVAKQVRRKDPAWQAPTLWRSEFRNVLYQHMAHRGLSLSAALQIADEAEADMQEGTMNVSTAAVLRLVDASGHSAYDCEYVALAQERGTRLVTGDQRLPQLFPETAVLMEDFVDDEH